MYPQIFKFYLNLSYIPWIAPGAAAMAAIKTLVLYHCLRPRLRYDLSSIILLLSNISNVVQPNFLQTILVNTLILKKCCCSHRWMDFLQVCLTFYDNVAQCCHLLYYLGKLNLHLNNFWTVKLFLVTCLCQSSWDVFQKEDLQLF